MFKLIKKSLYAMTVLSLIAQGTAQAMGASSRANRAAKLALRHATRAKQEQYFMNSTTNIAETSVPVVRPVQAVTTTSTAMVSPLAKNFANLTVTAIEGFTAAKSSVTTKVTTACNQAMQNPTVQSLVTEAKQTPVKLARIQASAKNYATEFAKNSSDNIWQAAAVAGGSSCLAAAIYLYNKNQEAEHNAQMLTALTMPVSTVTYANQPAVEGPSSDVSNQSITTEVQAAQAIPTVDQNVTTVCPFQELIGLAIQIDHTADMLIGYKGLKEQALKLRQLSENAKTTAELAELQAQADDLANQVAEAMRKQQESYIIGRDTKYPVSLSTETLKKRATGAYQGITKENAKWAGKQIWNGTKWIGSNAAYYTGAQAAGTAIYSRLPNMPKLKLWRPVSVTTENPITTPAN